MGSNDGATICSGSMFGRTVNRRMALMGVWFFVVSTALYLLLLGLAASRQEIRQLRLCEPQRQFQHAPQTVLRPEVFREVPPEECEPSKLFERTVDPSHYEFGCDEIEEMLAGEKKLVGQGNIRNIYLVAWERRTLVVKTVRPDFELRATERRVGLIHRWEAAALDAVRGHPNIVKLLGVCKHSSVSEYFPARLDDLIFGSTAKPLPISSVVSMALDAARGVQALHEAPDGPIVHYDIKPQQMMLDDNGTLKITDLNMCLFAPSDADGNSCSFPEHASPPGPFRAPENFAGQALSEKVDVYTLAMTFYSMLALKPPCSDPGQEEWVEKGILPPVDPCWHPGFMELVQDMWQRDPRKRPSARRVAERLELLQKQLHLEGSV